jgi:hypothetical protein
LVLTFAVLLLIDAVRMYRDLKAGQRQLSGLQLAVLDTDSSVKATVGSASRHLHHAAAIAHHSPWLAALRTLPVVGAQIDGTRRMTTDASRVGDIVLRASTDARQALNRPRDVPSQRLSLLDTVNGVLSTTDSQLAKIHPELVRHLLGPFARSRDHFVDRLKTARIQLSNGVRLTAELRSFLAGPRSYLVVAGNNAEMRGGGIATAAAIVHVTQGDLQVGHFIPSFDLYVAADKTVAIPPAQASMFGWMNIGHEWRTTDTSPNWPEVASLYARMSAQSQFGPVDGVLFVDVVTLKALLAAAGPVTVDGAQYSATNVAEELLYRNYLRFPTETDLNARHDQQGVIASAIFEALRTRSVPMGSLAHSLSQSVKGRHLLAWSSRQDEQELWTRVGASGAIAPYGLMISPQNVSASKLDYFIKPRVTMNVTRLSTFSQVDLTVTIYNAPRHPTSPMIEGGQPGFEKPGDHRVYLLVYLPSDAFDVGNASPGFVTVGTDGGMKVVGMMYTTALGQTSNTKISFRLPLSWANVVLLPSGRLNPIDVTVHSGRRTAHYTDAAPVVLAF